MTALHRETVSGREEALLPSGSLPGLEQSAHISGARGWEGRPGLSLCCLPGLMGPQAHPDAQANLQGGTRKPGALGSLSLHLSTHQSVWVEGTEI